MDVRSKQKPRKRRTRRNLNDLRKRSRKEQKNNVPASTMNILTFKNIPKYHNKITTGENLSLAMFKKVIQSNTVSRCHNTDHLKEIITKHTHQPQGCFSSINKSSIIFQNNNIALRSRRAELFGKNICQIIDNEYDRHSVASCLSHHKREDIENLTSEVLNYSCDSLSTFNPESSGTEPSYCSYEKFMNELPAYLIEHFPTLTSSFLYKNTALIKQCYLESNYQENENNIAIDINSHVNLPENHSLFVIQDPLVYIRTRSWEHSVQKKQNILLSNNCSSSLSEFESDASNIFINSPDYQYFPHKLN